MRAWKMTGWLTRLRRPFAPSPRATTRIRHRPSRCFKTIGMPVRARNEDQFAEQEADLVTPIVTSSMLVTLQRNNILPGPGH
jgi:hypothetical protein